MPGTDLGQDTGTATLNATAKVVELFLALLNKLYEQTLDPEKKMKRAEYKDFKETQAQKKLDRKLDISAGEINLKTLQKSGAALEPINLYGLKPEDKERFAALCKRDGVVFFGTFTEREDGKLDYHLVVRRKDLERVQAVTSRLNEERRINDIDERIADIWKKPEVTEQDLANIRELQRQKEQIQRAACTGLNQQQADIITDNAVNSHDNKPISLDEALNRNTGRQLDKDVYTIVADSQDPSKYIRCHGYTDTYKGKEYIKTDYEVYSGGKQVFATHDGRFDGRPEGYWEAQKAAIMEHGGFTGTVFKFYTETEYQRWAEHATRENAEELSNLTPGTVRTAADYDRAIETLNKQLSDHNVEVGENGVLMRVETSFPQKIDENGEIQPVETRKPLHMEYGTNLSPEQRAEIAECFIIKEQIDTFTQMKAAETELTQARAYAMVMDNNTPPEQRKIIEDRVSAAEETMKGLQETEAELYTVRKDINAVQADQTVAMERENGQIKEPEKPLVRPGEPEQAQTEQATPPQEPQTPPQGEQTQEAPETADSQHPESMGREEIVIEDNDRQKTLEEWKATIQDDRAQGAGQGTPEAEKGARQTAKQQKSDHGDR